MAKEIWTDPNGGTFTVDPSKWNEKELKLRTEQGWKKGSVVVAKPAEKPPVK